MEEEGNPFQIKIAADVPIDNTAHMPTRFTILEGQRFYLHTLGDEANPPLLFLHGFPEYGGAWRELAELLAVEFYCVAPDQRGFGQSWAPDEISKYTLTELVGDMAALITQLGGKAIIVGHDWGAAVAYGLAMFTPHLVDKLIIMNGVHPVPFQRELANGGAQCAASQYILRLRESGSEAWLERNNFEKLMKFFSADMDLTWLDSDRLAEYQKEWARTGKLKTMVHWYRASPLAIAEPGKTIEAPALPLDRLHVACPHLLIWGEKDTALLPQSYEGLEAFCSDLTIETLDDGDHWLNHTHAVEIAQMIRAFLDR